MFTGLKCTLTFGSIGSFLAVKIQNSIEQYSTFDLRAFGFTRVKKLFSRGRGVKPNQEVLECRGSREASAEMI